MKKKLYFRSQKQEQIPVFVLQNLTISVKNEAFKGEISNGSGRTCRVERAMPHSIVCIQLL